MADAHLHYNYQINEYHVVNMVVVSFNISFLTKINLHSRLCQNFLHYLLVNDIVILKQSSKILYTGMLNDSGDVIDDLVVYYLMMSIVT
ncbi:MAG: hypothetical protein ACTS8H_03560 [Arsenophonus sp. NC-PE1-MAG3]